MSELLGLHEQMRNAGPAGKITGKEGLTFEGEARCFDSELQMLTELAEDHESFRVRPCRLTAHQHVHCLCFWVATLAHRTVPDHCLAMFTKLPNTAACTSSQGIDVSLRGVAHSAPASVPGVGRPNR